MMLRTLNELRGFQLEATDGIVGRVAGVYFDDVVWRVRYVVVNTGSWLDSREVLISPTVLGAIDAQKRLIATSSTKAQVAGSPSIDLEKPVSRQQEAAVASHYAWPEYWNMGLWESRIPATMMAMQAKANQRQPPRDDGDPHLRSSREMIGYHLHALDDTLGHVEDFVVDESWAIRYLAVNTSNWWFGGHVLIAPRWIRAVKWPERILDLAVTRDVIKHSPTWTPSYPVTPEYEASLLDYYHHRQAWSVDSRSNEIPFEPNPLPQTTVR